MKILGIKKLVLAIGLAVSAVPALNAAPMGGGNMPAELVGKWKWGTINPTWFEDKSTGQYLGHAGGVSAYFQFEKNGRFKHYVYIEQNSSGWKTQTFTTMEGTLEVTGDVFKLKVDKGSYKSRSNRVERHNFDRSMTDQERADQFKRIYKWSVAEDEKGQPILQVINGGQGPTTTFRVDK